MKITIKNESAGTIQCSWINETTLSVKALGLDNNLFKISEKVVLFDVDENGEVTKCREI